MNYDESIKQDIFMGLIAFSFLSITENTKKTLTNAFVEVAKKYPEQDNLQKYFIPAFNQYTKYGDAKTLGLNFKSPISPNLYLIFYVQLSSGPYSQKMISTFLKLKDFFIKVVANNLDDIENLTSEEKNALTTYIDNLQSCCSTLNNMATLTEEYVENMKTILDSYKEKKRPFNDTAQTAQSAESYYFNR